METLQLSQGYVAVVDDEDFERVAAFKWHACVQRRRDGSIRMVYARRTQCSPGGGRTKQYLHRVILGLTDPRVKVDHRSHDGLDNRRENLRICTNAENRWNSRKPCGALTSQYKGVHLNKRKNKWYASMTIKNRQLYLGYFDIESDAAAAYDSAAREYYGDFALTNAS